MTQDDIIRMVEEAGADFEGCYWTATATNLERFAALVAAHEREACAKIADRLADQDLEHNFSALIAHNIRARGNT